MLRWIVLAAMVGCADKTEPDTSDDTGVGLVDADSDGYSDGEDCDDNNALVNPGAAEVCDGLDNNCDDIVDEGVTTTFYADSDGDGFGDEGAPAEACEQTGGYVSVGNDCDDTDPGAYPGAPEVCDDVDNDCDGDIDEGVTTTYYSDADRDGFGDPDATTESCQLPPDSTEDGTDCDDTNPDAYPGNPEVCDEADNNCDGTTDEGVTTTYYADTDADGFGDPDSTTEACSLPTGYAEQPGDCDDTTDAIRPDAAEVCNAIDDDCDGDIDDDDDNVDTSTGSTFYTDADTDGFGDPDASTMACLQPTGHVSDDTDCDDSDADVNTDAAEVCNSIDDDCDGDIDDDDSSVDTSTGSTFYADADSDGFGDSDASTMACLQPAGHVSDDTDCDDSDADVSPDGDEVCNSIDDDCDGDIDDDDSDVDTSTGEVFYTDSDGDGYGDPDDSTEACVEPSGMVSDASDCDDSDAAVNEAAAEVCDDIDNDCDGDIDDDDGDVDTSTGSTFYEDDDGDGYGDELDPLDACSQPTGFVANDTDCDDTDADVSPGEAEVCNSIDDDCDGDIDDDDSDVDTSTGSTFYADADADGYGDSADTVASCAEPSGYTGDDTDCDDDDGDSYPGASELCDGVDNDCDDDIDEGVIGQSTSCPAESCAEIVALGADDGDDDYYLDPDGSGGSLYACDMTTDGGGWTEVVYWNRIDDGDTQSDFESLMTQNYNTMGNFSTTSTALWWNDKDSNSKAMDYDIDIIVDNDGEVLFTLEYFGESMEDSGVWFYVSTDAGDEEDLWCEAVQSSTTAYSSTESGYIPAYTCGETATSGEDITGSYDKEQHDFGDAVVSYHITSLHYDNGSGDNSYLYNFAVWVR